MPRARKRSQAAKRPASKSVRTLNKANGATEDVVTRRRRGAQLDDADVRLIELLSENGRASNRIRNLLSERVLGITAVFDWEAAGYSWDLWLAVQVEGRPIEHVAEEIAALQYVHGVFMVFGPVDLVVHLILPGREQMVEFVAERVAGVWGVRHVVPSVTLETLKYLIKFARLPVRPVQLEFPAPTVDLDALDHQIVDALVVDGRQSNREIARQLGVSEGTIRVRVRRLEDSGLLRICGQTDPYLAGQISAWACVGVDVNGAISREVAAKVALLPEVVIVAMTAGPHDLFLLTASSSRAHLVDLIIERVRGLDGVRATETWEIVRTVKLDYHWARLLPG
jgi:Lrp/AsnC family transcriptional regulator for asnA, asnC and gidA